MKGIKGILAFVILVGVLGVAAFGTWNVFFNGDSEEPDVSVGMPVPGAQSEPEMVVSGVDSAGMPVPGEEAVPEMIVLGGESLGMPVPASDGDTQPVTEMVVEGQSN